MCKCTPEIRTPFCGKTGCQWKDSNEGSMKEIEMLDNHLELIGNIGLAISSYIRAYNPPIPKNGKWLEFKVQLRITDDNNIKITNPSLVTME